MSNPKVIAGFCLAALAIGFLLYFMNPRPEEYRSSIPASPSDTSSTIPAGVQMEDGTVQ
jgi:hypothetical protein